MRANRNKPQQLEGAIATLNAIVSAGESSESGSSSPRINQGTNTTGNARSAFYEAESPGLADSGDDQTRAVGELVELRPRQRPSQAVVVPETTVEEAVAEAAASTVIEEPAAVAVQIQPVELQIESPTAISIETPVAEPIVEPPAEVHNEPESPSPVAVDPELSPIATVKVNAEPKDELIAEAIPAEELINDANLVEEPTIDPAVSELVTSEIVVEPAQDEPEAVQINEPIEEQSSSSEEVEVIQEAPTAESTEGAANVVEAVIVDEPEKAEPVEIESAVAAANGEAVEHESPVLAPVVIDQVSEQIEPVVIGQVEEQAVTEETKSIDDEPAIIDQVDKYEQTAVEPVEVSVDFEQPSSSASSEPIILSQSIPVRPDLPPVEFVRHDEELEPEAVNPARGKFLSLVRLTCVLQDVRSSGEESAAVEVSSDAPITEPTEEETDLHENHVPVCEAEPVEIIPEESHEEAEPIPLLQSESDSDSVQDPIEEQQPIMFHEEEHGPIVVIRAGSVEESAEEPPSVVLSEPSSDSEHENIAETRNTEVEPQVSNETEPVVPNEPESDSSSSSIAGEPATQSEQPEPVVITLIPEDYTEAAIRSSLQNDAPIETDTNAEPASSIPVQAEDDAAEVIVEQDPLLEHFLEESEISLPVEIDIPAKPSAKLALNSLEYSTVGALLLTGEDNVVYDSGAWTSVHTTRLQAESQHLNHGHVDDGHVLVYFSTWKSSRAQGKFAPTTLNDPKALYHMIGVDDPCMDYFTGIKLAQENMGEHLQPSTASGVVKWNKNQTALELKNSADVNARIREIRQLTEWMETMPKIDIFKGAQIGGLPGQQANVIMHPLAIINDDPNPRINSALHLFYERCYDQLFSAIITRKLKPSKIYLSAASSPDFKNALSAALKAYRRLASYLGRVQVVFIHPSQ